jgi:hypothetical protein
MCKPEGSHSTTPNCWNPQQTVLLQSLLDSIDRSTNDVRATSTKSNINHSSSQDAIYSLCSSGELPLEERAIATTKLRLSDVIPTSSESSNDSSMASSTGARIKKRRQKKGQADNKDKQTTEKGHKRVFVQHNYHDYSVEPIDSILTLTIEHSEKKNKGGICTPFPVVLHDMLEKADQEGFSNIVSWQPHGRAFQVHDQTKFISKIMP